MSSLVYSAGLRYAGIAAAAVLLAACNQSSQGKDPSAASAASADAKADSSTAVATVNGTPISRATYDIYLSNITKANKIADPTAEQKQHLLKRLDHIEEAVNRIKMPLSFADQLFVLRSHVNMVRDRLALDARAH